MKHIKEFDEYNESIKDNLESAVKKVKKGVKKAKSYINPPILIEYKIIKKEEDPKSGEASKPEPPKTHKFIARYSYDHTIPEAEKLKQAVKEFKKEWKKSPKSNSTISLKIVSCVWSPGNTSKPTLKFE